ncbi:MAG TPA: archease, partial [Candidatus Methanofastidiosa archaeon]|nr:archease [Candidatus Methanofastidiosa archaeon]
ADNIENAFEKAGMALFSLMLSSYEEGDITKVPMEIRSEDIESLLYDYLEHLLVMFEVDDIIATAIHLTLDRDGERFILKGDVSGFKAVPLAFKRRYDVKAITYHMMEIRDTGDGWMIQVIVDI